MPLTVGGAGASQNGACGLIASRQGTRIFVMSMTQLVIGAALGFIIAQALLFGLKRLLRRLRRGELPRLPRLPRWPDWRGSALLAGFIRYAAPLGASAAVVALGVWSVSDYLAAKAAHSAAVANLDEPVATAPLTDSHDAASEVAGLPAVATPERSAEPAPEADPYKDVEFKVRSTPHRAGTQVSLKEKLVQREEAKARSALLREMKLRAQRSQYDCEAAEHAGRYLKAGLDVWGFNDWQTKYFPTQGYRGATLAQCQNIKNLVDPSTLNLQSTVAQDSHAAAP